MEADVKALIDLNVILDVLQRREPFHARSAEVLALTETGQVEGWVAAHSLTTLFYIMARYHTPEQARVALTDLLAILTVAPVDQNVIRQALGLPYPDFEDAVQMMAAVGCGAEYVITRNPRDFRAGPLPVLQPAELLALL